MWIRVRSAITCFFSFERGRPSSRRSLEDLVSQDQRLHSSTFVIAHLLAQGVTSFLVRAIVTSRSIPKPGNRVATKREWHMYQRTFYICTPLHVHS
jgi:hypothetical protein